jgi:5'-nucleotidase
VTLSFVGTNDLHGHIRALPLLAGYLENLRRARERDGGAVLLIDAGDMFQGTLESNLVEGASVIAGMNELDYVAAAVGNHEFDYGPVGEASTPTGDGDDPRGALIARAGEATFPIMTANILVADTGERVDWHENMPPTKLVDVAGVQVGIIGISTAETLRTTASGNVRDLAMAPLVDTITTYTEALRSEGADVIVVSAHAGGKCEVCSDPTDSSSCEEDQEIFQVARALPEGFVDLIVAGHTHRGVAHEVNGIAIIEAYAYGIAFGRVDMVVDPGDGSIVERTIHAPRFLCENQDEPFETCEAGDYEGAPVSRVDAMTTVIAPFLERAAEVEAIELGVRVEGEFTHDIDVESALGNLLADVIRRTVDGADVGLMNGGGIRAGLREGDLTYGELHRVFPFDNRLATARITGEELEAMVRRTLRGSRSIDSYAGIRVRATCDDGELEIDIRRDNGRRIRDDEELLVVASDFLVTGGNDVLTAAWRDGRAEIDEGALMRDQIAERLTEIGRVRARTRFDPRRRRVSYPGERPVSCE